MTPNPRDYRAFAAVLQQDMATLLFADPESFDCLVFQALDASRDETVSIMPDVVGSVESGERAQEYAPPIPARARIIPDSALFFDAMGGMTENFLGASQPMNIALSVPGVRKYSLIQWAEYPDMDKAETAWRTVYVLDSKPIGRTLGIGVMHVCLPLPALGEIPETEAPAPEEGEQVTPEQALPEQAETVLPEQAVPAEVLNQNVTGGY